MKQPHIEGLFVNHIAAQAAPSSVGLGGTSTAAQVLRPLPTQLHRDEGLYSTFIGRKDHGLALDTHRIYGVIVVVIGAMHVAVSVMETVARAVA